MKFSSSILSSFALVAATIIGMPGVTTPSVSACDHHGHGGGIHHDQRGNTGLRQSHRHNGGEGDDSVHNHHHRRRRHLETLLISDEEEDENARGPICGMPESLDDEVVVQADEMVDAWFAEKEQEHRRLNNFGPNGDPFPLLRIDLLPWKEVDTVLHLFDDVSDKYDFPTQEQIDEQMIVLNKAFAPGKFRFNLINITYTTDDFLVKPRFEDGFDYDLWYDFVDARGADFRQGGATTLNVFIHRLEFGGFATFPWDTVNEENLQSDSVSIHYKSLPGQIWGGEAMLGHILIHEVGHHFGLMHVFQGGCGEIHSDDYGYEYYYPYSGDHVSDTPPQANPGWGCPVGQNSCADIPLKTSKSSKKSSHNHKTLDLGVGDDVQNFLSYGDDACTNHFTTGQLNRMHRFWMAVRVAFENGESVKATPFTPLIEGE